MKGSLIVSFDEVNPNLGESYYTVVVNGIETYRGYFEMSNLFSSKLELGDVVTVSVFDPITLLKNVSIKRIDYTTDEENGDRGLKETQVGSASGSTSVSFTFTATTRNDAYGFQYVTEIVDTGLIPSPTPTPSITPSITPTNTVTATSTVTPTPTITPTTTVTPTPSTSMLITPTPTPSITPTSTVTTTPTITPTNTVTPSSTLNSTPTPTITPTNTPNLNCFNIGVGFNGKTFDSLILADNRTYIGGNFTAYNGTSRNRIVRLNDDGSLDNTFSIGTGANGNIHSIGLQSDNKIICVGQFSTYNAASSQRIVRINTNGTRDASFTSGFPSVSPGTVFKVVLQSDDKIIICGNFSNYSGLTYNGIVRLNTNGSPDLSFGTGTGFNSQMYTLAIQSDGKILVGGDAINYNGTAITYICRLNTDGTIDNTFNVGTGPGDIESLVPGMGIVNHIKILNDGKILVSGNFRTFNGVGKRYIVKLNSDGSIDNTFNGISLFGGPIYNFDVQNDGKIICVGSFVNVNGTPYRYICKFDSNGNLDTTYDVGSGFFSSLQQPERININTNNKSIITGQFTSYNGVSAINIIRLNSDGTQNTCNPLPTPTPTPSVTATITPSLTPNLSPTPSVTPGFTPTPTPTPGFIPIDTSGLTIYTDAKNNTSYSGTGITWKSLVVGTTYDATLYNSPTFISTLPQNFSFDGTNDFGIFSNGSQGLNTTSKSFGGWVNVLANNQLRSFYIRGIDNFPTPADWSMSLGTDVNNRFIFNVVQFSTQYTLTGTTSFTSNNWYYISATFDISNSQMRLYVNGIEESNRIGRPGGGTLRNSEYGWILGMFNNTYSNVNISTFEFYENIILTPTQILNNFNAQKSQYGY